MACNYETPLEAVQASFYFSYIKHFPTELIDKAISHVCATADAMMIKGNCPLVYNCYMGDAVIAFLFDAVDSVDAVGNVSFANLDPKPKKYLKSRKILDVECTWDLIKDCKNCESSVKEAVKNSGMKWLQLCRQSFSALGGGTNYGNATTGSGSGCRHNKTVW
ncbi:MAG: hypothetical protein GKR96_04225 [Gammaproteobacteria bacterium]|nr:hypothetical protein [Gammaproteobacteria bacterium]